MKTLKAAIQYNIVKIYLSGRYPAFIISNSSGLSTVRDRLVAIGEVTGIDVDLKELNDNVITIILTPIAKPE